MVQCHPQRYNRFNLADVYNTWLRMDFNQFGNLIAILSSFSSLFHSIFGEIYNSCSNEVSYGFKQNFTWNISTTTGFYISQPHCFDANAKLIERYCKDDQWKPKQVICKENLENNQFLRKFGNSPKDEVETILTFDPRNTRMLLMIYNPINVKTIKCSTFKDGYINVDWKMIYDSNESNSVYSQKRYQIFELDIDKYPNEYRCEIFQKRNSTSIKTQGVVGHELDDIHQEYVVKLDFRSSDGSDISDKIDKFCDSRNIKCRVIEIERQNRKRYFVWVHVTLFFRNNKIVNGYYKLYNMFENQFDVAYVRSAGYCLPETHNNLTWVLTPLGEKAKPSRLCLNTKGFLITRKCVGDFRRGAYFEKFTQKCSDTTSVSKNTQLLYEIVSKHNFTAEVFKNFTSIVKEDFKEGPSSTDVSLFSDGLFETSEIDFFEEIEEDYFDSVDGLNVLDSKILVASQVSLNATDRVLDSLEKFLVKKSEFGLNETIPTVSIRKNNFIIFATKPSLSNISGIALYGDESKSFLNYQIKELTNDDMLQTISRDNLELAVHVPQKLIEYNGNSSLIITIYYKDALFNEEKLTNVANSRVIGITMPEVGKYLTTPINLLLRPLESMNESFVGCGYWEYGKESPTRKGQWSTKGGEDLNVDDLIYCTFSHLTHFGLLILSGRVNFEKEGVAIASDAFAPYNYTLNIITIVGCSFSLVGIVGIFTTAGIFRKFREKIGTKILLLLSVPISLEIVLTQLAGLDNWHNNTEACLIIGILLHYVVLLKFTWMFVIAFLQYLRFVKVLGPTPPRIFLKANLICWSCPLIPVVISAAVSPESYTAGVQKFCYPKDLVLYLGLLAPASTIVVFNLLIFSVIMVSISKSKAVKYDKSGRMLRRQTYLAILLFFMLGIPWVFGVLAEVLEFGWLEISFIYLFCLTATFQGFVLFVFYVIFDKDTRGLWVTYIKYGRK